MTAPEPLEVAAWRLALDDLRPESLPELATDALVRGLDSPSLRILAGQNPADARDSRDLFAEVLTELGIAIPDPPTARWRLARMSAAEIVQGHTDPGDGARALVHLSATGEEDDGYLLLFVALISDLDDDIVEPHELDDEVAAAASELLRRSEPRR